MLPAKDSARARVGVSRTHLAGGGSGWSVSSASKLALVTSTESKGVPPYVRGRYGDPC